MKTGMVLGIIGGVIGLLVGAVGFGLTGVGNSLAELGGAPGYFNFYRFMSLAIPIAGLIGAGILSKQTTAGSLLLAIAAIGTVWAFGLNILSIVVAVLFGVGALLAFSDKQNTKTVSE